MLVCLERVEAAFMGLEDFLNGDMRLVMDVKRGMLGALVCASS